MLFGPSRRFLISSGLALLVALAMIGVASAHASLIKADPVPGAVLGSAPTQIKLWYDEDVDVNFSDVQVLDKNLVRVDNGDLHLAAGDSKQLAIALKPLSDGTYTVSWKVLSSTDGHITRGNFAFSVGNVAGPVVAASVPTTGSVSETDPLSVLVRWVNLLAFLSLVGSSFYSVILLRRSLRSAPIPESAEAAVWGIWRQLALAAFLLGLFSTLAGLLVEASLVANVSLVGLASSDAISRTLLQTRFGSVWIARMILLVTSGSMLTMRFKFAHWIGLFLGVGVLLTISLGGHEAAAGGVFSLALVGDWIHLTAVAVWVGGLFSFLATMLTVWRRANAEKRTRWIGWMLPQFSAVAIPATAVIAITGVYSSLLQVPTFDSLIHTDYGETLIVKVTLFLVMVAFGGINLLFLSPRFRRAITQPDRSAKLFSRFRLTVVVEVLLGLSVIMFAGLLTLEPPARASIEQPNVPSLAQNSNAASRQSVFLVDSAAPDVQVTLTLSPTEESPTTFDVFLSNPQVAKGTPTPGESSIGKPITNVLRVILQFTLLDQDVGITTEIAQAKGDGHFVVSRNDLTLPGMWKIHVIVRRAGVEDVAVDFPAYRAGPKGLTATSDPKAMQALQASEEAMNQLQSLHSKQDLNDGSNGVVITDYDYRAPDAMRFDVQGEASSIAIGANQYYQDKNGNWTERARVDPFIFPQFNASTQAQGVQLGRPDILSGQQTQIVRYVIPDASGGEGTQFAQWISTQDRRLVQLAMVAPSHYMMQYYMDYDSPQIAVAAPSNVVQPTAAPLSAPSTAAPPLTARLKGPITGDLEADVALVILVAGFAVGIVASGRKRVRRLRLVMLGLSSLAILTSIGLAADAFNGMAAAVANAPFDTSQAALGRSLYDTNCAACHGTTGHGDGPAGKSLPVQPFDLTTHVLLHDEQYLDAVISEGRGYMPAWKDRLTQDQIFDIIAYTRLLAQSARKGSVPGFTPQPGFTPLSGFTPQPWFSPGSATPPAYSLSVKGIADQGLVGSGLTQQISK